MRKQVVGKLKEATDRNHKGHLTRLLSAICAESWMDDAISLGTHSWKISLELVFLPSEMRTPVQSQARARPDPVLSAIEGQFRDLGLRALGNSTSCLECRHMVISSHQCPHMYYVSPGALL